MKAFRNSVVPAVVLAAAGTVLALPMLVHDALPAGSDLVFAHHAAHGFQAALSEGVPYPRWVDNSNLGFGGAIFVYYAPLPYYLVSIAGLVLGDPVSAFRSVLIAVTVLSGWTFFVAARGTAGTGAALVGAAFYVLAPYHALDLYDRFAFAEFCAFVWLPVIWLGIRRIVSEGSTRAWLPLAVATAGLILTHLVSTYMALLVLGPYVVLLLVRTRRWRAVVPLLAAGGVALAVSAVFWLPMIVQRDEVHMEWVSESPYGDWRRNFVYRDEVALGYTPAAIKPWVDRIATVQAIAGLAAIVALAVCRHDRRGRDEGEEGGGAAAHDRIAAIVLAGWTFFLQVPVSAPVWSWVPELGTVQFPWRFGLFQALVTAFLVAFAVGEIGRLGRRARRHAGRLAVAAGVAIVGTLPALAVTVRLLDHPVRPVHVDAAILQAPENLHRVMPEYLPRGLHGWDRLADRPYRSFPEATLEGPGTLEVVAWTTHRRVVHVDAPSPTRLYLRTFLHPGWRATVDGARVELDRDNPNAQVVVPVPSGEHDVVVRFAATRDRTLGAAISVAGVLVLVAGAIARRRHAAGPDDRRP